MKLILHYQLMAQGWAVQGTLWQYLEGLLSDSQVKENASWLEVSISVAYWSRELLWVPVNEAAVSDGVNQDQFSPDIHQLLFFAGDLALKAFRSFGNKPIFSLCFCVQHSQAVPSSQNSPAAMRGGERSLNPKPRIFLTLC